MSLWLVIRNDADAGHEPALVFGPVDWSELQSPTRLYAVSTENRYGNRRELVLVHDARGWHREHETVGPAGNRLTFVRKHLTKGARR